MPGRRLTRETGILILMFFVLVNHTACKRELTNLRWDLKPRRVLLTLTIGRTAPPTFLGVSF